MPGATRGGGKECSHERDRQVPATIVVGETQKSKQMKRFQIAKGIKKRGQRRWDCVCQGAREGSSGEEAIELSSDDKKDVTVQRSGEEGLWQTKEHVQRPWGRDVLSNVKKASVADTD